MGPKLQLTIEIQDPKTARRAEFANRSEAISPYPHSHHNLLLHSLSLHIKLSITPLPLPPKKNPLTTISSPLFTTSLESEYWFPTVMAAMNSSVLACNYAITGAGSSELNAKLASTPSVAYPVVHGHKLPVIRAQQAKVSESKESRGSEGRRAALLCLTATLFTAAVSNSSANAGVIEDYLEKSKANKVCHASSYSYIGHTHIRKKHHAFATYI